MANIEQLEEGKKFKVELEGGEIYEGDPLEATTKLAASKEESNRYIKQLRAENDELKQRQVTPPTPTPTSTPPSLEEIRMGKYVANVIPDEDFLIKMASVLGLKPNEVKSLPSMMANHHEAIARSQRRDAVSLFHADHPEFPNTPAANEALVKYAEEKFKVNLDNLSTSDPEQAAAVMEGAHLALLNRGTYRPLTTDEQNQTLVDKAASRERGTPPPMIRSSSPENRQESFDESTATSEQLRARYFESLRSAQGQ